MLRFVLSTLALAALLPLTAGAAPFGPFNVFDPTPRGVVIDFDADNYAQDGLYTYVPNPAFVPDPNYPLFGYDHTDPNMFPFIRPERPDNNLPLINQFEGSGLGEPFNDTLLTKSSGDEFLTNAGNQALFGLDCDLTGVSANAGTPDCLFPDPLSGFVAGGGDPLLSLGVDGYGIAGMNPSEPGVYTTDYVDVAVGQDAPSIQAGISGSSTILAFDPNNPASLAQRADLRWSTVSGAPGVGAWIGMNPYRAPIYGQGSIFAGSAAALGPTPGLVMAVHEDFVDGRVIPAPDPNFPLAAVAPVFAPNPLSLSSPAHWTSNGSVGTVTLRAQQVYDFFALAFIGSVLQVSPDFTNLDPNDPTSTLAHGCNFLDPGAIVPAIGCFTRDSRSGIPIISGPDLIKPWSDWVIEIDLVGGQFDGRSAPLDVRVTGTGTIWDASSDNVVPFDMWQQTYSGPWVDPNDPRFQNRQVIPGTVPGVQQAVQIGPTRPDFFCSTDGSIPWGDPLSLNSPSLGVTAVSAPTFDSTAASSGGGQGATSGGDIGGGGGALGVNGLVYTDKVLDLSDAMGESPCHVLQTVPYDVATGVYRAIGPLFAGNLMAHSELLGTGGLREVPEPGAAVLLGLGLAGLAALRRRKP